MQNIKFSTVLLLLSSGDQQPVSIGHNTNIQDSAYVGSSSEYSPAVQIGSNVSIGHGAIIKGATIGDHALIGINAVVSEGAKVRMHRCLAHAKLSFAVVHASRGVHTGASAVDATGCMHACHMHAHWCGRRSILTAAVQVPKRNHLGLVRTLL